jgi:hypothetical protein
MLIKCIFEFLVHHSYIIARTHCYLWISIRSLPKVHFNTRVAKLTLLLPKGACTLAKALRLKSSLPAKPLKRGEASIHIPSSGWLPRPPQPLACSVRGYAVGIPYKSTNQTVTARQQQWVP